jgi:hypothetical protein
MTASELLALLRTELDDVVEDYLWSDATLYRYLDLAIREFAVRTEVLRDSTTPAVCEYAVSEEVPELTLHSSIMRVDRAVLRSTGRILTLQNDNEPLETESDYGVRYLQTWTTQTGTPTTLICNYDWTHARLAPIPETDDFVDLTVVRGPIKTLDATAGCLELKDVRHQYALLDYAKYLAYSVNDADVVNPKLAAQFLGMFNARCGEFRTELVRHRRQPGNVRYGGY